MAIGLTRFTRSPGFNRAPPSDLGGRRRQVNGRIKMAAALPVRRRRVLAAPVVVADDRPDAARQPVGLRLDGHRREAAAMAVVGAAERRAVEKAAGVAAAFER